MNILQKFYTLKHLNNESSKFKINIIFTLVVILVLVSLLSVSYGSVRVSVSEIFTALVCGDNSSKVYRIIAYVRIPRTLAAVLAGSSLAVCGVILQAVLNNALAGPNIIGVNAGSGLFTLIAVVLFPGKLNLIPAAAFVGALFAALLIYFIAYKTGASRVTIVLSGVAVSSLLSAGINTIITFFPDAALGNNTFLIGGLTGVTMDKIRFAVWYILIGLIVACILSYDMNILSLGDEMATSLGLKVGIYRFILIIVASVLAGGAVSFAGLLGFVGLIIPHMARVIIGSDNRFLIPISSLMGGIFVVFCDLLSRILFAPFEIPVGIIMSFLGGPFFIYILLKQKRSRIYD